MNQRARIDLLCRLETDRFAQAGACVVVAVDERDGTVCHATGPFAQPEQALAQAGRDHADWDQHASPGEAGWLYVVVPLWEPS